MMKYLLFVFCIFTSTSIFADCNSDGMNIWPYGNTLKINSILSIEGYGWSQPIIKNLNKKYPVYLKSTDKQVRLKVKEILIGEYGKTQAILVPEEPLQVGVAYTLHIDKLKKDDSKPERWNPKTNRFELVAWTVVYALDTGKPVWIQKPIEEKKVYIQYGCGPGAHVKYAYEVNDFSNILIKANLKNLNTNKTTSYYIIPEQKGILLVGHGMCYGEFSFDEQKGDEYEISFDLMDECGNFCLWEDKPLKLQSPSELNSDHDD